MNSRLTYRAPGVPIRIYYYSILPFTWQGQVEGAVLLMEDVTEQVRLSEEVRQVERPRLGSSPCCHSGLNGSSLSWGNT
jgi:hypothetical protein